jgi:uncharacterized protein
MVPARLRLRLNPVFNVNRMEAFDEFVASWAAPDHPRNQAPVVLNSTEYGNISETGELGDYRGHALSRWHPQFASSVEEGIRPLVLLLVERCGYITYTSCEGHSYPGRDVPPVERHVGLLPRDEAERQVMVATLRSACRSVGTASGARHVRMGVLRHKLETQNGARPVVTLFFFRRWLNSPWSSYFSELDEVTRLTVKTLTTSVR